MSDKGPYTKDVQIRWLQETQDKQVKHIAELQAERDRLHDSYETSHANFLHAMKAIDRLEAQVEAVRALHFPDENDGSFCCICDHSWPCSTSQALDAEPADTPKHYRSFDICGLCFAEWPCADADNAGEGE